MVHLHWIGIDDSPSPELWVTFPGCTMNVFKWSLAGHSTLLQKLHVFPWAGAPEPAIACTCHTSWKFIGVHNFRWHRWTLRCTHRLGHIQIGICCNYTLRCCRMVSASAASNVLPRGSLQVDEIFIGRVGCPPGPDHDYYYIRLRTWKLYQAGLKNEGK